MVVSWTLVISALVYSAATSYYHSANDAYSTTFHSANDDDPLATAVNVAIYHDAYYQPAQVAISVSDLVDDQPFQAVTAALLFSCRVQGNVDDDPLEAATYDVHDPVVTDDVLAATKAVFYVTANDYDYAVNATDDGMGHRHHDRYRRMVLRRDHLLYQYHYCSGNFPRDHFHPSCFHLECTFFYSPCDANGLDLSPLLLTASYPNNHWYWLVLFSLRYRFLGAFPLVNLDL